MVENKTGKKPMVAKANKGSSVKARSDKVSSGSSQRRKQRLSRHSSSLHLKQKYVHVNLSKELRAKHGRRQIGVRKGDIVKILRGQFKGKQGKVTLVELKRERLFVEGIEFVKKDGSKVSYPIHPSNLQLKTLELSDKKRKASIARGKKKDTVKDEKNSN